MTCYKPKRKKEKRVKNNKKKQKKQNVGSRFNKNVKGSFLLPTALAALTKIK